MRLRYVGKLQACFIENLISIATVKEHISVGLTFLYLEATWTDCTVTIKKSHNIFYLLSAHMVGMWCRNLMSQLDLELSHASTLIMRSEIGLLSQLWGDASNPRSTWKICACVVRLLTEVASVEKRTLNRIWGWRWNPKIAVNVAHMLTTV